MIEIRRYPGSQEEGRGRSRATPTKLKLDGLIRTAHYPFSVAWQCSAAVQCGAMAGVTTRNNDPSRQHRIQMTKLKMS